jgi:hypothetical protein
MVHEEPKFELVSHFGPYKLEINFHLFCKHFQITYGTKSNSTMHEELKLELGSHLGPKFELGSFSIFFCCNPCQPTFKSKSNLTTYEESKFKLTSHLGLELEFEFCFGFLLQALSSYS